MTIIFLLAVVTLQPFAIYSDAEQTIIVLVALLVCLIPTTIGALLSAIGIAGMDRLVQRNVLAMSGRAVEAAGDVQHAAARQDRHDHLRQPPGVGVHPAARRRRATSSPTPRMLSSLADETPEGRSIVSWPRQRYGQVADASCVDAELVPFTAQTRMSGVDFDGREHPQGRGRLGQAVGRWSRAGRCRTSSTRSSTASPVDGGTPLAVAELDARTGACRALGVIHLKDIVKQGMRERFDQLRAMGIRTVMITGDNPLTARRSPTRPASTTSSPRPRPRTRWR